MLGVLKGIFDSQNQGNKNMSKDRTAFLVLETGGK